MCVFEHFDGAERGVLLEPTLRLNFVAESEVYEWEAVLPSDGVVGEPVVLLIGPAGSPRKPRGWSSNCDGGAGL